MRASLIKSLSRPLRASSRRTSRRKKRRCQSQALLPPRKRHSMILIGLLTLLRKRKSDLRSMSYSQRQQLNRIDGEILICDKSMRVNLCLLSFMSIVFDELWKVWESCLLFLLSNRVNSTHLIPPKFALTYRIKHLSLQFIKWTPTSQIRFGLTNFGSNMHHFWATAFYFCYFSNGTPCTLCFDLASFTV